MAAPRKLSTQEQDDVNAAKSEYERRNGRPCALPEEQISDVIHSVSQKGPRSDERARGDPEIDRRTRDHVDAVQRELDLKLGTATPAQERTRADEANAKIARMRDLFRQRRGRETRLNDTDIMELVSRVQSRSPSNVSEDEAILAEMDSTPEEAREGPRPPPREPQSRPHGR